MVLPLFRYKFSSCKSREYDSTGADALNGVDLADESTTYGGSCGRKITTIEE